jgi:hypothetical protein
MNGITTFLKNLELVGGYHVQIGLKKKKITFVGL